MFFDGGREKRAVSLAGKKKARPNPQETAQKSAQAKLQRELEMKRHRAATAVQRTARGWSSRCHRRAAERAAFDAFVAPTSVQEGDVRFDSLVLAARRLCFVFCPQRHPEDHNRLLILLRMLFPNTASYAHKYGWQSLWLQHVSLLRSLLTAMYSYLHSCLDKNVDWALASFVESCVREMLTLRADSSVEARVDSLKEQFDFVKGTHRDILDISRRMIESDLTSVPAPLEQLQKLCGDAIASYLSFVQRVLSAYKGISSNYKRNEDIDRLDRSVWRSVAVCILSAPQAARSPVAAPSLALFASHSYKEWVDCGRCMTDLLSSVLPDGEATVSTQEVTEQPVQRALHAIHDYKSTQLGEGAISRGYRKMASAKSDKFGVPMPVVNDVSVDRRTKAAICVLNFLANISSLPVFLGLAGGSKLAEIPEPAVELLFVWMTLANSLYLNHRACQVPIHAGMQYLDFVSSATTDPEAIPALNAITLRHSHDQRDTVLLVPATAVVLGDVGQEDIEDDSMDVVDEDNRGKNGDRAGAGKYKSVGISAGKIGGMYVESAIQPLFNASALDELGIWNDLFDQRTRCSLLDVMKFSTSTVATTVLEMDFDGRKSSFCFNDLQLLVISVLSILISSSDNPFPGNRESKPSGDLYADLGGVCSFSYSHRNAVASIINAMAFNTPDTPMIKKLWSGFSTPDGLAVPLIRRVSDVFARRKNVRGQLNVGEFPTLNRADILSDGFGYLYLMCITQSHQLVALQDDEFYAGHKSIDPGSGDLNILVDLLKDSIYHLSWDVPVLLLPFTDEIDGSYSTQYHRSSLLNFRLCRVSLLQAFCRLYNHLSIRNERRGHHLDSISPTASSSPTGSYLPPSRWIWTAEQHPGAVRAELYQPRADDSGLAVGGDTRGSYLSGDSTEDATNSLWDLGDDAKFKFVDSRMQIILLNTPQVVAFEQRAVVLHTLILSDQSENGMVNGSLRFDGSEGTVRIRRNEIIGDAFMALDHLGPDRLKRRFRVIFFSEDGHEEAGIDGGGLFKEFLESFMKTAFDPASRFFTTTETHELIPSVPEVLSEECIEMARLKFYRFIGKMLAKAVYSEILLEPQFSPVFLNLLLGRTNSIDDMSYLDRQFYKSLMNIKQMILNGEDVQMLGLHFQNSAGNELIKNGRDIPVTNANALTYIYLLAKHKLNLSVAASKAFLSGFREIIPVSWLRMFNPREMQSVLGGELRPLDMEDLQRNVAYAGGYHPSQPYIKMFWEVVAELTPQEQGDFLKFITSCSRQPLLGFDKLNPKIGIQEVPARYTEDGPDAAPRLPSAGTCFNLLKLPRYESKEVLKEKLKYAIKCNTGFELS